MPSCSVLTSLSGGGVFCVAPTLQRTSAAMLAAAAGRGAGALRNAGRAAGSTTLASWAGVRVLTGLRCRRAVADTPYRSELSKLPHENARSPPQHTDAPAPTQASLPAPCRASKGLLHKLHLLAAFLSTVRHAATTPAACRQQAAARPERQAVAVMQQAARARQRRRQAR